MNIQQLEYVIAVDTYRHFAKAAEASFVTQPTLSMMIQKMEDELGVKIFDRSAHPITPTDIGEKIITQARITLKHFKQIVETVQEERQQLKGSFHLGIIPTIAPYLVPGLLKLYGEHTNKQFQLTVKEYPTDRIVELITAGVLDGGILATPLKHDRLVEHPIYYEKFYAYISPDEALHEQKKITLKEFENLQKVWILEDVHCFRTQMLKLCQFSRKRLKQVMNYEAGSIDTLINIVDNNSGGTMIPELAAAQLPEDRQDNLRDFTDITAVREVSMVVSCHYVRQTMLNEIVAMVRRSIPTSMQNDDLKEFVVDLSPKSIKKAKY
ncbi:MAG: hydrogen peroxide-inducible genes activator [Prevotellaceae bacterium]|jgi:LysR family hydrogen peroxide-inducible transcriptional activator|nr:hydrogen peroxide-inducible genes activator [Prevotellaceae bacterium]